MAVFAISTKLKICVLGETVGKSSLINRYVNNKFSGKQIEHNNMQDIHHKQLELMNETFSLEIIDTTNNDEEDRIYDDILKIEWKGMDGYSLDIREEWLTTANILFLCFNRVNRLSWMILQALYDVSTQYLKKNNITNIPIYIISTCSDLYLSQTSLSMLDSDLVSFKEVEQYISKFDNTFVYETSAKMNHNIDTIFKASVKKYNELHPRKKGGKKKKRKRKKSTAQISKNTLPISKTKSPKPYKPLTPMKLPKPKSQPPIIPKSPLFNAEPVEMRKNASFEDKNSKIGYKTGNNNNNIQSISKAETITTKSTHNIKNDIQTVDINNEHCNEIKQEVIQTVNNDKKDNILNEETNIEYEEHKHNEHMLVEDEFEETQHDLELEMKADNNMDHNGYNGYNGYNGHMKKEHLVHVESPFSLSSAEIYNIEYSSKYKESMDFKNIQKMFNKYHQIKLFYAQSESTNGGITTDHVFFKDLDATLTTIGCMDQDKKMFFITCRQHIINKMVHTINVCKNQYEYLATITLLTGPLILRLDQVERNNYWSVLSDASFVSKLAINYDDWMINNKKSENEFKNEISGALHINPIYIRINGVGKGLEDIVIDWTVMYIWIPYYIQGVTTNLIYREYRMRPQDQIEVQYDKKWIPCTILEVKDTLNKKGKQIKVRYNKLNGNDRYFTNTEWLWTIKHYDRLRLPDQVYVIVSYNGVKIGTTFKPPLLAYVRGGNKKYLDIGHHIFVNRDNIWYRCEIINVSMETDKAIQVLYLVNTFVKNTEWLTLSDNHHLKRISLEDMRIL